MRSHPSCWNKTLAQLGFRRKRRKAPKHDQFRRRSLFEALEQRQMLSGDPLLDPATEEPIQFVASDPEYHLYQPEMPIEDFLSLTEEERAEVETVFLIETVQTESGPKAIISFNPDSAVGPPAGLQRLQLELQQNGRVIDTYEILIDIAEESFREQFLEDRIANIEVSSDVRSLSEATDATTRPLTTEELAQEVAFWDAFIGPKTLEQQQRFNAAVDGTLKVELERADLSADDLVSIAKSDSLQRARVLGNAPQTNLERKQIYTEVEKQTEQLKQDRLSATTDTEREAITRQEKSLSNLTLALAKNLREDLNSTDATLAQSAQKVRDELVAISDPMDILFAGLNVDNEVERTTNIQGDEKALSFVETGRYVFDNQLEIDLGEHQAMVQVTRLGSLRLAAATSISESPAVEDGFFRESTPTAMNAGGNRLRAIGTANDNQESLIRFDLNQLAGLSDPTTIASAVLELTELGTGVGNAEVYAWNGLLDGGTGSVTDWDETNLRWDRIHGSHDFDSKLGEFTRLNNWEGGTTTSIDVTSHVQRALLFGDANGDGVFGAAGSDGDIEAFHLAVTNWDAYVAEYGPRANSASDLLARTDGGLGDGAIDTGDIADFFRRHGYSQGDYNLDGTVQDNEDSGLDGLDWATWHANYGLENARFTQGDGNFDGVIDNLDYNVWLSRKSEDILTAEEPEIIVWVRPEDSTTNIKFASQEHATQDGPTLVVTEQPDLALNKFSVDGSNLVVDYAVLGDTFTDVKVQLYKVGSPDTLLHETAVQSGSLGTHEVLIATSVLSSIVEGDSIYAKVVGTPASGTQSNLLNDQLDFEFSTDGTQTVNSLDDAGMDTLLRDKYTLRELIEADESLGWFDTLALDDSLFGQGQKTIVLGDHSGDLVADRLDIYNDLTISGPGSKRLAIDARNQSMGIVVQTAAQVTFSDLTITGGYSLGHGAGIYNKGDLTINGVTVSDSSAQSHGGGIYNLTGSTLDIQRSTIDGNTASYGGGISGVFHAGQSLTVNQSTISNNTGSGHTGGLNIFGTAGGAETQALITNSTFSGNSSDTVGGALRAQTNTDLRIVNSTITRNDAVTNAGGIFSHTGATTTLHNTILADNSIDGTAVWATDASGDIGGTPAEPSTGNLIGIGQSGHQMDDTINQVGTTTTPIDPMLDELKSYGLHAAAHVPLPGSPAIDRGDDSLTMSYGAQQSQSGVSQWTDTPGTGPPLKYSDIGSAAVYAGYMTEVVTIEGQEVPAVTELTATPTQIRVDLSNDELDSDLVDYQDYNAGDPDISLREALEIAKQPGNHIITFDASLTGETFTLNRDSEELVISQDTNIIGLGVDQQTIDANASADDMRSVFRVEPGVTASIEGLTITGGNSRRGGGINNAGSLMLDHVKIEGNTADIGGGIYLADAGPVSLNLTNSTIDDNSARLGGGLYSAASSGSIDIDIVGSTFSKNRAESEGGAMYLANAPTFNLDVSNSTFSGNEAEYAGGGIHLTLAALPTGSDAVVAFTNVTVAENELTGSGGGGGAGIHLYGFNSNPEGDPANLDSVELHNSIVARNTKNNGAVQDDIFESGGVLAQTSSYNLIGDADTAGGLEDELHKPAYHNIVGMDGNGTIDPKLSALGNYGGPTATHALLPDSRAIDAGGSALVSSTVGDQRGPAFWRLRGTSADIGAYEAEVRRGLDSQSVDSLFIVGSADNDEIVVTPNEIYMLGIDGASIPFDPAGLRVYVNGNEGDDSITLLPGISDIHLHGDEGNDTLIGSSGDEVLEGGDDDDELFGRGGNDTLRGGRGSDTLHGGDDDDFLYGGDDQDALFGGAGTDRLWGDDGNDHLDGGYGGDFIEGGNDNDTLVSGGGTSGEDDTLDGQEGDDRLIVSQAPGIKRLHAQGVDEGYDTIDFSEWSQGITIDLAQLGTEQWLEPSSTIGIFLADPGASNQGFERIVGSQFDDNITGDSRANLLEGRGGNDTILGGGGDDQLLGGAGNDRLLGHSGSIISDGGYGNDRYWLTNAAAASTISIRDAEGVDTIEAYTDWVGSVGLALDLGESQMQNVTLDNASVEIDLPSGSTIENAIGSIGTDRLTGNSLANRLEGTAGDDEIVGDIDDVILGGAGLDSVEARSGADAVISGGTATTAGVGFNDEQREFSAGQADWTFESLPPGEYQVFATWETSSAASGMAADYSFTSNGGSSYESLESDVDQNVSPVGTIAAGRQWLPVGDTIRLDAGGNLGVRLEVASAASAALVDAVRVVKIEYLLDATLEDGGAPVSTWIDDGSDNSPILDITAARASDGSAVTIDDVQVEGPMSAYVTVADSSGSWTADFTPPIVPTDLPAGTYPVTFRIADGKGGVGVATLLFQYSTQNTPPEINIAGLLPVDPLEDMELSFDFTVTDPDHTAAEISIDLAGDVPESLRAAYETNAGGVIEHTGSNAGVHSYTFRWTPTEADDGEQSFELRATDSGATPIRHSVTIDLNVVEDNTQADILNGIVNFVYAETASGERANPTISTTITNDGNFRDVRLAIDWTYNDTTFSPDQYVQAELSDGSNGQWALEVTPDTYRHFWGELDSTTKVAIRAEEFDTSTNSYGKSAVYTSTTYKPVDTSNLTINTYGLVNDTGTSDTDNRSSDITLEGTVLNPDGPVSDLVVNFYSGGDGTPESGLWLGTTRTDDTGAFEFAPRFAFDLDDFADQDATIRAEVLDSVPTLSTGRFSDSISPATASDTFTLIAPSLPDIDSLVYSDAPVLAGFGFLRQPKFSGQLDPSHSEIANVTIEFDHDNDGSFDGIAVTDDTGAFDYYPDASLGSGSVTASSFVHDNFRRNDQNGTDYPLTFVVDGDVAVAPDIVGFDLTYGDGGTVVYLPTVGGRVEDDGGLGIEAVIVEFSAVAVGSGDLPFDVIAGRVMTDENGDFDFTPYGLSRDETYTIYARTVGWDHIRAAGDERVFGATSSIANVQLSDTAPVVILQSFDVAYDTGLDTNDNATAYPTLTGQVGFDGDMRDVEVEIDFDGDGEAEVAVLPDENGMFSYTPDDLVEGQTAIFTAWAIVPHFVTGHDLDPVFDEQIALGESLYDDIDNSDATAQAWLDSLFVNDHEFGGDWINAEFKPNWDDISTSDPLTTDVTLEFETDPTYLANRLSVIGLQRPNPGGVDPTLVGTVQSDADVSDLLLEFFFVEGGDEHYDGEVRTALDGSFVYTPQDHSTAGNHLRVRVHESVYGSDDTTTTDLDFTDAYAGDPIVLDTELASMSISIQSDDVIQPIFSGELTAPAGVSVVGRILQFDVNGDDRVDDFVVTDGLGHFEHAFTQWAGPANGTQTIKVRVTEEHWSDDTNSGYLSFGGWQTLTWNPATNDPPTVDRFELLIDTGYFNLDGDAGVDPDDYRFTVLDRVTTDPTVVGVVADAPPYSEVEFSHQGDGIVDGSATTDEFGRFEYRPLNLDYGHWDIHVRLTEKNVLSGTDQTTGWQPLTESGDPSASAAMTGFTLVPISLAQVTSVVFTNPATGGADQRDPRMTVTVTDADSIKNVVVDFYEGATLKYLGSTTLEDDGTAVFMPIGISLDQPVTITAIPSEPDPKLGSKAIGTALEVPLGTVVETDRADDSTDSGTFRVTGPHVLRSGLLSELDATVFGEVQVSTRTEQYRDSSNATTGESATLDTVTPLYVELRVTHFVDNVEVEKLYDTSTVIVQSKATSTSVGEDYRFTYQPDMSRWSNGMQSNDRVEIEARPVGVTQDGEYVLHDWGDTQTITSIDYRVHNRTEIDFEFELTLPLSEIDEGTLDGTTTNETIAPSLTGSLTASFFDEDDDDTENWREAVGVTSWYVEIDYAGGLFDGTADLVLPIDNPDSFDVEIEELGFGDTLIKARLVEELHIDEDFAATESDAYKDELESSTATIRVSSSWKDIRFTLLNPAPTVDQASMALGEPEPDTGGNPATIDPIVTGSIFSDVSDNLGGFTIEFDHDGNSIADGTTLTFEDGTFEYLPLDLQHGEITLRARAVDYYGDDGTAYGDWVEFVFDYLPVPAPTLPVDPSLEANEGTTVDGKPRTLSPVIQGSIEAHPTLTNVEVEFDFEGGGFDADGLPDWSESVDLNDDYRFVGTTLPFGDVSVRVRAVGLHGGQRIEGAWSDPLEFFHSNLDAPAVSLALEDVTTGVFNGRATVGGYGADALIEIIVENPGDVEFQSFVRTDRFGEFTVRPPQLSNSTIAVRVRGIVDSSASATSLVGEWNELLVSGLNLPAPGSVSFVSLDIANPDTGNAATGYADPTLKGKLTGDYSTVIVEFDYDYNSVVDAQVPVREDGTFEHTPTGLFHDVSYPILARWKQWHPVLGDYAYSVFGGPGAEATLTIDPDAVSAPTVDVLELASLIGSQGPIATTSVATFQGSVNAVGNLSGLTVWFDHNGDGVADGRTATDDEGKFVYHALGIEPSVSTQTVDAWVEPPQYMSLPAGPSYSLEFLLTDAPEISFLSFNGSTSNEVVGSVDSSETSGLVVEYQFLGQLDGSSAPTSPVLQDLSDAEVAYNFESVLSTGVNSQGQFQIDVSSLEAGVVTLFARARIGDVVGRWERIDLAIPGPNGVASTLVPLIQGEALAYDTGTLGDDVTNDPTVVGRVGELGQGAFSIIEVNYTGSQESSEYIAEGRLTADAFGEFHYTPPVALGPNTLRFRSVAWDTSLNQEVYSAWTAGFQFTLVDEANPAALTIDWQETPNGNGEINDPTVTGTVAGLGRHAGVRVEFNHGDGLSVDGIAYTDANGEFTYTPLGLMSNLTSQQTLIARVVAWNEQNQSYERADFADAATASSVGSVSAFLTADSPPAVAFGDQGLADLSNDALALSGYEDAIFSVIESAGLVGNAARTIDVAIGELLLLHGGGGEDEDELGTPVFAASSAQPSDQSSDSGTVPLVDYVTAEGAILNGSYQVIVDVSTNGATTLVDEISFRLVIDSYEIQASQFEEESATADRDTSTRLELSGDYTFEFVTAGSHATYAGSVLTLAEHLVVEDIDYDYLITETVASDDEDSSSGEPIVSTYVASGGAEYQLHVGNAGGQGQAAEYATYSSTTGYTAPISQTEVTRIDDWGDGEGGAAIYSGGTAGTNPSQENVDHNGDGGIRTTYVETVTKDGDFVDASTATGTITVTIEESREETFNDTRVVSTESERSTEATRRVERYSLYYHGTATYTTGASIEGSATLTESRSTTISVSGGGSLSTDGRSESWSYIGTGDYSSTLVVSGTWFESLDAANPSSRSSISGTYNSSFSGHSNGGGGSQYSGQNNSRSFSGQFTQSSTGSLSASFSASEDNGLRQASGTYTLNASGSRSDFGSGSSSRSSDGDYDRFSGRISSTGSSSSTATTTYATTTSPSDGPSHQGTTTYTVSATGYSNQAGQFTSRETNSDGVTSTTSRGADTATVSAAANGTVRSGYGMFGSESSRSGTVRTSVRSSSNSSSTVHTPDGSGSGSQSSNSSVSHIYSYDGSRRDGVVIRNSSGGGGTGTGRPRPGGGVVIAAGSGSGSSSNASRSSATSYSINSDGRSSDSTSKSSDSGRTAESNSTSESSNGQSSSGSYSARTSNSERSASSLSTGSGGDANSRGQSSIRRSASLRTSGNQSTSGDGYSTQSSGSTSVTERGSGSGTTNNDSSETSGDSRTSGSRNGRGSSSSTSQDGGQTVSRWSRGSSNGRGSSNASDTRTRAPFATTHATNFDIDSSGDGRTSGGYVVVGNGSGASIESSASSDGNSGSSGERTYSSDGDGSTSSEWNERNNGSSRADFEEWSNAGKSQRRFSGSSSSKGSTDGSGSYDRDGSDGNANERISGSSKSDGETTTHSRLGDTSTRTVTTTESSSNGTTRRGVSAKDGEVSGGSDSEHSGGDFTRTTTTTKNGPTSESETKTTYTSTSSTRDGKTTGTEKNEWDRSSESESNTHTDIAGTETTIRNYSISTADGYNTETVTDSEESSSAKTASFSDTWNYTENETREITATSDESKFESTNISVISKSNYSSGHRNGKYGAVGGSFNSSSDTKRERDTEYENRLKGFDAESHPTTTDETGGDSSKSGSTSEESGSYYDTREGRQQSGRYETTKYNESKQKSDSKKEGRDPDTSEVDYHDHIVKSNKTDFNSTTTGSYNPSSSTSKREFESSSEVSDVQKGLSAAGVEYEYSNSKNVKNDNGRITGGGHDKEHRFYPPDPNFPYHNYDIPFELTPSGEKIDRPRKGSPGRPGSVSLAVPSSSPPTEGELYVHYLFNPSQMDSDLQTAQKVSLGVAAGAAVGAAGAAAVGTYGAKAVASAIGREIIETGVEAGITAVTGVEIPLPSSPTDLLKDTAKSLLKRGGKKLAKETAEKSAKKSSYAATKTAGPTKVDGGFCFVAGTPVLKHPSSATRPETHLVRAESVEEASESSDNSFLMLAGSAVVFAFAGYHVPVKQTRKKQTTVADKQRRRKEMASSDANDALYSENNDSQESEAAMSNPIGKQERDSHERELAFSEWGTASTNKSSCKTVGIESCSKFLQSTWLICWLTLASVLGIAGLNGFRPSAPTIEATPVAAQVSEPTATAPSVAIEQLRPGHRVAGSYSTGEMAGTTEVDPATWRLLRLRATNLWEDGTLDVIDVETLQHPDWVTAHRAEAGAKVPLPLDLLDMGLPEEMRATVVANESCPEIEEGPGRVVLTTVNHLNRDVYELTFGTSRGETESVRTTGLHKFYRATDGTWVSAHDLKRGDQLEGPDGLLIVQSLAKVPGTQRVYNMTVEGEHVYRVSTLGALVHNNGCTESDPEKYRAPFGQSTYWHYTDAPPEKFADGFIPGSWVTDNPHLTKEQIKSLGVTVDADKVYPVHVPGEALEYVPDPLLPANQWRTKVPLTVGAPFEVR